MCLLPAARDCEHGDNKWGALNTSVTLVREKTKEKFNNLLLSLLCYTVVPWNYRTKQNKAKRSFGRYPHIVHIVYRRLHAFRTSLLWYFLLFFELTGNNTVEHSKKKIQRRRRRRRRRRRLRRRTEARNQNPVETLIEIKWSIDIFRMD